MLPLVGLPPLWNRDKRLLVGFMGLGRRGDETGEIIALDGSSGLTSSTGASTTDTGGISSSSFLSMVELGPGVISNATESPTSSRVGSRKPKPKSNNIDEAGLVVFVTFSFPDSVSQIGSTDSRLSSGI